MLKLKLAARLQLTIPDSSRLVCTTSLVTLYSAVSMYVAMIKLIQMMWLQSVSVSAGVICPSHV